MENFKVIVFTSPGDVEDEADKIVRLLDRGVDYVHIRKPGMEAEKTGELISRIPVCWHDRLKIHDNFSLLQRFPDLRGVHLNKRNPQAPATGCKVSVSAHSLQELEDLYSRGNDLDYVTLSPIYPSISKPGYRGEFDMAAVEKAVKGKKVVALGGVTPDKLKALRSIGFYGAALLGYIWEGDFEEKIFTLM